MGWVMQQQGRRVFTFLVLLGIMTGLEFSFIEVTVFRAEATEVSDVSVYESMR